MNLLGRIRNAIGSRRARAEKLFNQEHSRIVLEHLEFPEHSRTILARAYPKQSQSAHASLLVQPSCQLAGSTSYSAILLCSL
jgi:hypothetical protein